MLFLGIDIGNICMHILVCEVHLGIFICLGLGLDIYLPAGELCGKPCVLALFADSKGELIIGNDDLCCLFALIDIDHEHLCRPERLCDIDGNVGVPLYNIHLLVMKFVYYAFNTHSALTDACADCIDIGIGACNGDFSALTCLARDRLDKNDAGLNLGDLKLEKSLYKARMSP